MAPQTPQTLELTSFRRTFALLILLVVLPSAGLSGFGVVAIINGRAAVEKRLEAAWGFRLTDLAAKLRAALDTALIAEDGALKLVTPAGLTLTDFGFTVEGDRVEAADPRLKA